jgi:hypothetical protein
MFVGPLQIERERRVVVEIHSQAEADLAEIVFANREISGAFGAGERRQEQACKNRNNRNDDEKLDERKCRGTSMRITWIAARAHSKWVSRIDARVKLIACSEPRLFG